MLSRALEATQRDLDAAVSRLGVVESERLDGIKRIEESERRVERVQEDIERARREAEEEISKRIAAFRKFEEAYFERQQQFHTQ